MRRVLSLLWLLAAAVHAADTAKSVLIVNSTEDPASRHGQEFIPLIRATPGWEDAHADLVWVGDFHPALLTRDPKPLAIFFSGSFKDWCEVKREHWAGVEQVLKRKSVPIWASCGGAQALAILWETGTAKPWDCPHCRDPRAPKLPIYTHLGHIGATRPCGDYSGCIFERGSSNVRVVQQDAVFAGLAAEFKVMQSHCGQIAYPPAGWDLIATGGEGSPTRVQAIKLRCAPIYAAQFHIEMEGTPESSGGIMRNFLAKALDWMKQKQAPGLFSE